MKKKAILLCMAAVAGSGMSPAMPRKHTEPARQNYKIYVDDKGVMRRSDTKEEVSYYGTNYTVPFAYSYNDEGIQ